MKNLKRKAKIQKSKLAGRVKKQGNLMRNKLSSESSFELRFFEKHGVWLSQLDDQERDEYLTASTLKQPAFYDTQSTD